MHRATLTLLLAGLFGLATQLLFYREGIGLNALLAVALVFAVGWRLRLSTPRRIDLWMPAFALAFAALLAVRTEMPVVVFDVLATLTLASAWSASLRGVTVTGLPFPHLLMEAWETATGTVWRAVPALRAGLSDLPLGTLRRHRLLPALGGVLLALPLLLVFGSLFTSADPVFARWWEDLIDVAGWADRLREWRDRSIIAFAGAWIVLGALAWPARVRGDRPGRSAPLSSITATAFLATIGVLFAVFVAVQIAYLFGGRDTLEAAGMSYAEYARRGFFELLWVAAIVAAVLFALDLAIAGRTRPYTVAALTLLTLTGVVLGSALYRLDLYQREFGWSELRLYAAATIAAVAVALAIVAWAVIARRMRFAAQPIVLAAMTVAIAVNLIGPAGSIVRVNVARLQSAPPPVSEAGAAGVRERSLDRRYLVSLGPAGLADLVAVRSQLSDLERFCSDTLVYWRYGPVQGREAPSWQSWNLDRERARAALLWLDENVFPQFGDPADLANADRLRQRVAEECDRLPGRP